jgi:hypothetical protein
MGGAQGHSAPTRSGIQRSGPLDLGWTVEMRRVGVYDSVAGAAPSTTTKLLETGHTTSKGSGVTGVG